MASINTRPEQSRTEILKPCIGSSARQVHDRWTKFPTSITTFVFVIVALPLVSASCSMWNYCNGHGRCNQANSRCVCEEGWGAASDITYYRAPDCSKRTCPAGKAWADVPQSTNSAHRLAECSDRGACDRSTGQCVCLDGFTGRACERTACPNDCSGHGVCLSMRQMAQVDTALPLGPTARYEGFETTTTWDQDSIFGCLCDSSWPVGLGPGQTQVPEWFGADCSKRHCPSGDDPYTPDIDETDCENVLAPESAYVGAPGNLCYVECSRRGICDLDSGICECFPGYIGNACGQLAGH